MPARTAQPDALSKDLKQRGFNFVGSTICYAFMQAVGMVNDHGFPGGTPAAPAIWANPHVVGRHRPGVRYGSFGSRTIRMGLLVTISFFSRGLLPSGCHFSVTGPASVSPTSASDIPAETFQAPRQRSPR